MSQHNGARGAKLYGELSEDREQGQYSYRYPADKVSSSRPIHKEDIKYSPHERGASVDDSDRDYYPSSRHREQLRHPHLGSRRPSVY